MPRPALKNVSTKSLQAELQRRAAKLSGLLRLRDQVDRNIADLKALAVQFGKVVAEVPAKLVREYRRLKAKAANPDAKKDKRSQYGQTANELILTLLAGGKVLTSAELGQAWATAGRKGAVTKTLGKLVAEKKLARRKIYGKKGSEYSLAGKSVVEKAAAKPVAKKAKKTFTCPTCKKVYASGPMLGVHYKTEPAHRQK